MNSQCRVLLCVVLFVTIVLRFSNVARFISSVGVVSTPEQGQVSNQNVVVWTPPDSLPVANDVIYIRTSALTSGFTQVPHAARGKLRGTASDIQIASITANNVHERFIYPIAGRKVAALHSLTQQSLLPSDRVDGVPLGEFLSLQKMAPRVTVGFVAEVPTCLSNFWHCTVEMFLPLLSGLLRAQLWPIPKSVGICFFLRAPGRRMWGLRNVGCPSLNNYPYGFTSPAAWPLRALGQRAAEIHHCADGLPFNTIFFAENAEHRKYLVGAAVQPINISVALDHIVLAGLDHTCTFSIDSARQEYFSYPFILTPPRASAKFCAELLTAARTALIESVGQQQASLVPLEEVSCPKLLFLDRQGGGNGRDLVNWDDFVQALREAIPACGTVTMRRMELLQPAVQIREAQNATIVVSLRGAAAANVLLMRPLSGFLSLAPAHYSVAISKHNENAPWWPLPFVRTDIFSTLGVCKAVPIPDIRSHYHKLCTHRSANFCNMLCNPQVVRDHIKRLLGRMVNAALRRKMTYEQSELQVLSVDELQQVDVISVPKVRLLNLHGTPSFFFDPH